MKVSKKLRTKKLLLSVITAGLLSAGSANAQDWEGVARDAWIDGKIESSYLINTELNNFTIDTKVNEGHVTLTGTVPSSVHKDLAGAIANNIEGVESVQNELVVGSDTKAVAEDKRDFSTAFFDLTTTARLKSAYALNKDLKATEIKVDTREGKVTLSGKVDSAVAKELAEEIAHGLASVNSVVNQLEVSKS